MRSVLKDEVIQTLLAVLVRLLTQTINCQELGRTKEHFRSTPCLLPRHRKASHTHLVPERPKELLVYCTRYGESCAHVSRMEWQGCPLKGHEQGVLLK